MNDKVVDEEAPMDQTEDHVYSAVPLSDTASTVADLPSDFGAPGLVDFADPAWDDITDDDVLEVAEPDEPEPDEDDDEEPEEIEPDDDEGEDEEDPVVPPGVEEEMQPDERFDHDPEDVEED